MQQFVEPIEYSVITGRLIAIEGPTTESVALAYNEFIKKNEADPSRFSNLHCQQLSYCDTGSKNIHLLHKKMGLDMPKGGIGPEFELMVRMMSYLNAYECDIEKALKSGRNVIARLSAEMIFSHLGNVPYHRTDTHRFQALQSDMRNAYRTYFKSGHQLFNPHHHIYFRLTPEMMLKKLRGLFEHDLDQAVVDDLRLMVERMDRCVSHNQNKWTVLDATLPYEQLEEMLKKAVNEILRAPHNGRMHIV